MSTINLEEDVIHSKIGIVSNLFTEKLFNHNLNLVSLCKEDYQNQLMNQEINTVIFDNDLYEIDHQWYKVPRGHIINFLKNNNYKIIVIKNTSKEIKTLFKAASYVTTFVSLEIENYSYEKNDGILQIPFLINYEEFNPINTSVMNKSIDVLYLTFENSNYSPQTKLFLNSNEIYNTENFNLDILSKDNLTTLFDNIKKSKIIYINFSGNIDIKILYFIELISIINSTYVIYDYRYKLSVQYGYQSDSDLKNVTIQNILLQNEFHFQKELVKTQSLVFRNNTTLLKNSLTEYLQLGCTYKSLPAISVITSTNRKQNLKQYLSRLKMQNNVNLEIIIATHGFVLNRIEKEELRRDMQFEIKFIDVQKEVSLGNCLNLCIQMSKNPIIAKMDDDDYYAKNYLFNQWCALQYSGAEVVGKYDTLIHFEKGDIIARRHSGFYYHFNDFIMGATIMCKSELLKKLCFNDLWQSEDSDLLKRIKINGSKIFVNHPFDFCVFRHHNNNLHTWKVSNIALLKNSRIIGYGKPYKYI